MQFDTYNVHVGSPCHDFRMDDVKQVHFHDFANLTAVKDEMVESPEFNCAGYKWKLQLYPGGDVDSFTPNEDDDSFTPSGWISVHLICVPSPEGSSVEAYATFNIIQASGRPYPQVGPDLGDDHHFHLWNKEVYKCSKLVQRSVVLDQNLAILSEVL